MTHPADAFDAFIFLDLLLKGFLCPDFRIGSPFRSTCPWPGPTRPRPKTKSWWRLWKSSPTSSSLKTRPATSPGFSASPHKAAFLIFTQTFADYISLNFLVMLKGCLSFRNLLNTIHDKIYHSTKKTKLSKAKVFTQFFGTFFTRSGFCVSVMKNLCSKFQEKLRNKCFVHTYFNFHWHYTEEPVLRTLHLCCLKWKYV